MLQVTCKKCGFLIFKCEKASEFTYFNFYALPTRCPNCKRKLDILNPSIDIYPLNNGRNPLKKEKRKRGYIYKYIFTELPILRKIRCAFCGEKFKVGENVVSVRTSCGRRKQYHEKCFAKRTDVFPLSRSDSKCVKIKALNALTQSSS